MEISLRNLPEFPEGWPKKRKSKSMRVIEARNGKRDIRFLIIRELPKHPRDLDAAHALGLYHGTLSAWIARLSIEELADEARQSRATATAA